MWFVVKYVVFVLFVLEIFKGKPLGNLLFQATCPFFSWLKKGNQTKAAWFGVPRFLLVGPDVCGDSWPPLLRSDETHGQLLVIDPAARGSWTLS